MDDFNKLLNEELKKPEFKQEWEKLELITPPNIWDIIWWSNKIYYR